jgi:glycosyltransferase involved in cell wall biosynthesis
MNDQVISIIIPTYNYAHFLGDTLECVIHQEYNAVEIIVIDDGSTDDTRIVVEQYIKQDGRIKYFYQENRGLSAARNLGVEKSTGQYIQFLDADDLISKNKLSLQMDHFTSNPDLDISYCCGYYFKDGHPETLYKSAFLSQEEWIPRLDGMYFNAIHSLIKYNIMPVNSALTKKDALVQIGLFNEELRSLEDWEFWLRCAFGGVKFQYLEAEFAFALVRMHKNSMSQNRVRMYKYEIDVRLKIKDWILVNGSLNADESMDLRRLNGRSIQILIGMIIEETGLLNFQELVPLARKTGYSLFFKAYFKFLNERRKKRL